MVEANLDYRPYEVCVLCSILMWHTHTIADNCNNFDQGLNKKYLLLLHFFCTDRLTVKNQELNLIHKSKLFIYSYK